MPVQLYTPAQRPFAEIAFLALAIVFPPGQFVHVGFLYRNEADEIRLSHLLTHLAFRGAGVPGNEYFWLESHLNQEVCEQVAEYLDFVAGKHQDGSIPYSFLEGGGWDEVTGTFVDAGIGKGLTCATHILSVLRTFRINLIDVSTWPIARPGDIETATRILAVIEASDHPTAVVHVQSQRDHLHEIVRVRSEEVAAAFGMFERVPLSFLQVVPTSLEILQTISA